MLMIFLLSACQSPAEEGRKTVYNIYEMHDYVDLGEIGLPDDFYYSGFSSYTSSSEDGFKLILLKEDIYSELIIEWTSFDNQKVIINSIQIIYYDFQNEAYFSLTSEQENGLVYEGISYDETLTNLSNIRIKDIQWIIEELGYDVQ